MHRLLRPVIAGAVIFVLQGCASLQHDGLHDQLAALPLRVEHVEVPFYAQENYHCGPAALAMAFAHSGMLVSTEELGRDVFIPGREGSLQIEMLAAPRRHGLIPVLLKPQLRDLLIEVAAGQPVVVLQNRALDWYPLWHYAVVIGYDLDRDVVIIRSGTEQRLEISIKTFERTWRRSAYWAMLALPPEHLPQTVSADDYVAAVARVESAGKADVARRAYATALQRWPDKLTALIGQGNTAHAARDLAAAIDAYRRATVAHPDSAIAFNNLAQALADSGHLDEALAMANRAVGLAPEETFARDTLRAVQSKASTVRH